MEELVKKYGHLYDKMERISETVAYGFEKGCAFSDGRHTYYVSDKYTAYVYTNYTSPRGEVTCGWLCVGIYVSLDNLKAKMKGRGYL